MVLKPKHYIDVCFVHCFTSIFFSIRMTKLEQKRTGREHFPTDASD